MVRIVGLAAVAFLAMLASAPAGAETLLERQVLAAINLARTDPAAYADSLRQYRGFIHANLVTLPGQDADIETSEGTAVVDETIAFLTSRAPLAPVDDATTLEESAADHVADQRATGEIGHAGSDGSSPGERVRRRGGGAYVAEVIAYGPVDAVDAVRQLIVDDGVADRGHRSILYSPELRFAGVSCGPHPQFRTMCVIDLSISPDGRIPEVVTRMARADTPRRPSLGR